MSRDCLTEYHLHVCAELQLMHNHFDICKIPYIEVAGNP